MQVTDRRPLLYGHPHRNPGSVLVNARYLSKLDLSKGYYQVVVAGP